MIDDRKNQGFEIFLQGVVTGCVNCIAATIQKDVEGEQGSSLVAIYESVI